MFNYHNGELIATKSSHFCRKKGEPIGGLKGNGYKMAWVNGKDHYIHRFGLIGSHQVIDHINCNKLDNRIENLRLTSRLINNRNVGIRQDNKSGHKGVHFCRTYNRWRCRIKVNKKQKHIGYFENIDDAINARRRAELKFWN